MFTMRLLETTSQFGLRTLFMNITDLPNGHIYHHDKPYMKKILARTVHPYNFHMCWTQGKVDKLKYMKLSGMWYLNNQAEKMLLTPKGANQLLKDSTDTIKNRANNNAEKIAKDMNWVTGKLSSNFCSRKPSDL
jgi:hypothetical protein